jgi:hypothetical protein
MYSTYEDARARERELLHLARKTEIGVPGPRRGWSFLFRLNTRKFLTALRERSGTARKPAIGRAA